MDKKLTHEQINEKLDAFRWSRCSDGNYEIVKYGKTCRNSVKKRRSESVQHHCENCQEDFISNEKSGDVEIDNLVKRLKSTGLIAKAVYYCDDCVSKYNKNSVEIWVKAVDSVEWIVTVPKEHTASPVVGARCVSDAEYTIVENILTKTLYGYSAIKGGASNYKLVFEKDHVNYGADIVKFKVDAAIYKVLGFDLEYDMEVVKKSMRAWLLLSGIDILKSGKNKHKQIFELIESGIIGKYSDFEGFMNYDPPCDTYFYD